VVSRSTWTQVRRAYLHSLDAAASKTHVAILVVGVSSAFFWSFNLAGGPYYVVGVVEEEKEARAPISR
jgi:hypothetical protein